MRRVQKVRLELREGNRDEIWEIELLRAGPEDYLVCFRHGRRGKEMREGTRTSSPVDEARARAIFDELVRTKIDAGYRQADVRRRGTTGDRDDPVDGDTKADESTAAREGRAASVLERLMAAPHSATRWKLSRAVWRAGELGLSAAEPRLLELIGTGDAMLDYSIAWALGRCGTSASVEPLRRLQADKGRPGALRRIAGFALLERLEGVERQETIAECFAALPEALRDAARLGPPDALSTLLSRHLQSGVETSFHALELLYLIDDENTRPVVLDAIREAPLEADWFQRLRYLFKAAEMRRDGEVFGLFAHRVETHRPEAASYAPGARRVLSARTRLYLRKRFWWTLERSGQAGDPDYVHLASGVLASFVDADARAPTRTFAFVPGSGGTRYQWFHRDSWSGYWAFQNILFGRSTRYVFDARKLTSRCEPPYEPGAAEPAEREESFPELWDRNPGAVLALLGRSRCEVVHRFGVKVLRQAEEYCDGLHAASLVELLTAPYEVTQELVLDLARRRHDPAHPDAELLLRLVESPLQRARRQSVDWITASEDALFKDLEFVVRLSTGPFAEGRQLATKLLKARDLDEEYSRSLWGRLLDALRESRDDAQGPERARDLSATLLEALPERAAELDESALLELLAHETLGVQRFAGEALIAHPRLGKDPPGELLHGLLESEYEEVRETGVRLLDRQSEAKLRKKAPLMILLTRHRYEDIRERVRPVVHRLAGKDAEFGRSVAEGLVDALLVPGAPEGVPGHTARVLLEDLRQGMAKVPTDTVHQLLWSRSGPARQVGAALLETNVPDESLDVAQMARLGGHEQLSVRETSWRLFRQHIDRVRAAVPDAIGILDVAHEDSREFARDYFREHLLEDDASSIDAETILTICDSVRPDVQEFGREMITRVFEEPDGEEYALRLSEHPSESMQLFASGFLERHAGESVERLRQLVPFVTSVLTRVNKGAVARDRAFRFLEQQATRSEEHAVVVAEILGRHSATIAIGDKARALAILLDIHEAWPSIELPIRVLAPETRGAERD